MNQRQLDQKLEALKTMDQQTMQKELMNLLIKHDMHGLTGEDEYYYNLLRNAGLKSVGLDPQDKSS